ncbi:MAG: phosphatase PAP2 family protein [Proteobacteria bacterium]|nr:phosphatase PAP2 family protein [Burkholderiales bacterium]
MNLRLRYPLARFSAWEGELCRCANRVGVRPWVCVPLQVASRLGDGVFWYALMAALLVFDGARAREPVLRMVLTGLICIALYRWLKGRTSRPRPYQLYTDIRLGTAPLDLYSFPSGHTLHAVAFSIVALAWYPVLAPLLLPFTLMVALSRVALGLHYPSDVIAGALLGALVATTVIWL